MRDQQAKKEDVQFFTRFGLVLAAMIGFAVVCAMVARAVSPSSTDLKESVNSPEAIAERLAPAGRILMQGAELPADVILASAPASASVAAPTPAVSASSSADAGEVDGEAVYVQACQLCHAVGLAGAPKPGDTATWQPRLALGLDTLYSNAINGIRGMPARGGRPDLSDAQVRASVDYMLSVK